jgi:hypothetical protein
MKLKQINTFILATTDKGTIINLVSTSQFPVELYSLDSDNPNTALAGVYFDTLDNENRDRVFYFKFNDDQQNRKFYFQPTTNVTTGGTGFTSTDDTLGAQADFDEMKKWGDDSYAGEAGTSTIDGMYLNFKDETESQLNGQFRTGFMDSLANAKPLDNTGRPGGTGTEDVINPFDGYSGGDYAWVRTRLFVPEALEDAGKRQIALYLRTTYTF